MPDKPDREIIKELITHINAVEEKTGLLKETVTEAGDLVTVNKLDIINLKNEIEKIKLSIPDVSPDTLNKLHELEKISGKIGQLDKLKNMEKDINSLKSMLSKSGSGRTSQIESALELINQRVRKLESQSLPEKHKENRKIVTGLEKRIGQLEDHASNIIRCRGCGALLGSGAKFCSRCGKKVVQ